MGKALVIVESPSKAKIINGYLGANYIVTASVGHIRDLPDAAAKGKTSASAATKTARTGAKKKKTEEEKLSALFVRMGVDPLNHWKAHYEIMPDKIKVVNELKRLVKDCDAVYLATDLDREGEAIAWHLREVLATGKEEGIPFWRVKYPEITKAAIAKAFANPGQINMDLVKAQQTRRFLDRVVGFMLSPLLWEKVGRNLSAGRVQSVAVELIVDREREIKAFIPVEYWTMGAETLTPAPRNELLTLQLVAKGKDKIQLNNAAETKAVGAQLSQEQFVVEKVESKQGKAHAPAPFTTSTLQQTANQRLGFSVKRTMVVAQHLYESGLITYMRTDSVNLSQEAVEAARGIIAEQFGEKYLPPKPNVYQSKETAQEAHEAIRPSNPSLRALSSSSDRDAQRLYQLIYERYLACQMSEQLYETRTITVKAGEYVLRASGRTERFAGFRAILGTKSDDTILPDVKEGEILTLQKLLPERHFTQPPARYSEASLVKGLEKDGIGRPSTYASIIDTIQKRGYVKVQRNRFFATKIGEIVTDRLRYSFANLMDFNFTAQMEESLDQIASGQRDWQKSLDEFYDDFSAHLAKAQLPSTQGGMPDNHPVEIDLTCPTCGKYHMAICNASTGAFLSCMGYRDPNVKAKDRCKQTINLIPIEEQKIPEGTEHDESVDTMLLLKSKRCPICGSAMDAFLLDKTQKLYVCSNSPMCDGYIREEGDFSKEAEAALGPSIVCDKCGHEMVRKEGRFGPYMKCTNADCDNTRRILKSGEVAPPREPAVDLPELACEKYPESHFVLRNGASGIFLAAQNFPRERETRPIKVSELKRFRDRISPKFHYLADAPEFDPEGNATEVHFSRRTKEQYVLSVTPEGKTTSWSAYFQPETQSWKAVVVQRKSSSGSGSKRASTAKASAATKGDTTAKTEVTAKASTATKTKASTKAKTTTATKAGTKAKSSTKAKAKAE